MNRKTGSNNKQSGIKETPNASQILTVLSDHASVKLLATAYSGLKADSSNLVGNLSLRQYYPRLRRLTELGLVEKRGRYMYRTTSLGSLVYKSHIRTLDKILNSYWQLRAIDLLKERTDFPSTQKEAIINDLLSTSNLTDITNDTYLSGFKIVKDFEHLIIEVMRVLDNAEKEIYFASRYHDSHVSNIAFKKFSIGVTLHILDATPAQISLENRINAILRTAPNQQMYEIVQAMITSPRFELFRLSSLPTSFLVIDGRQVVYETVSYANPEEFTVAIANYDDPYLAERYIKYFNLLVQDADIPRFIQSARTSSI
jgi:hypothetical protein